MLLWVHMLDVRTNVLFQQEDYGKLVDLAVAKGVSVGYLIRKAVKDKYKLSQSEAGAGIKLVADLKKLRKKIGIQKGKVDYKAWVDEGRKY